MFPDRPLTGLSMLETFAGNQEKGGGMLSRVFERAGGNADKRDILINKSHDFHEDWKFWQNEAKEPRDIYALAPCCTECSIAKTIPKTRSLADPVGDEAREEIRYANKTIRLLVQRALALLSKGAHILIENPQLSYLWLIPEMLILVGFLGMYLVRIDHCTCGML